MTQASFATHEVLNQSPPFEDVDLFTLDRPLVEAVAANGGASAQRELSEFGSIGSRSMAARGRVANENTPKLRTFDARGNRRDEVEPPGLSRIDGAQRVPACTIRPECSGQLAVVPPKRARGEIYMAAQVETGHLCPITMTRASVAALAAEPDLPAKTMLRHSHARLRSDLCAVADQTRHDAWHGHDREAGRHRCALQPDPRDARWRGLSHIRA